jgi:hypothetical protein
MYNLATQKKNHLQDVKFKCHVKCTFLNYILNVL